MNRSWGFVPFAAVGVIHLTALFTGSQVLASATKPLLMIALVIGFLTALPTRRSEIALWGGLGILFSGVGDVLLSTPSDVGFLGGLGGFFVAHLSYLVLFLRPLKRRGIPWIAIVIILGWWVALVVVLAPYLGVLLIPVMLYGVALGSSTAASFGTSRLVAVGATLFLISDTVLAFRLFWPEFSIWQEDAVIMLAYILGQGLIAFGAARQVRHARVHQ